MVKEWREVSNYDGNSLGFPGNIIIILLVLVTLSTLSAIIWSCASKEKTSAADSETYAAECATVCGAACGA